MFDICAHNETGTSSASGKITIGDFSESFTPSTEINSLDWYRKQWTAALRLALNKRELGGLITDLTLDADGLGTLWMYTIIPSETAYGLSSDQPDSDYLYFTHRFFFVTVQPENFTKRLYIEFDDGTKGDEISLYYYDLKNPSRFFGYLGPSIAGISSWSASNRDIDEFLRQQ